MNAIGGFGLGGIGFCAFQKLARTDQQQMGIVAAVGKNVHRDDQGSVIFPEDEFTDIRQEESMAGTPNSSRFSGG